MFAINMENLKKLKYHVFLKNIKSFLKFLKYVVYSKCGHEYEKILKEEESIEILKILGLINNIEVYQKICNHA